MLLTDHQPDNYRISIWSLKSTQPEINWLPNLNDQNKEGFNILVHIVLHSVRTSSYIHYTQCFGTPLNDALIVKADRMAAEQQSSSRDAYHDSSG